MALVAVTLVCLSSFGGAMLYAFPVLVPLHWLATRESGPYENATWTLLAGLSVLEAGWMIGYVATRDDGASAVLGVVLALATIVLFLHRRLARVRSMPA